MTTRLIKKIILGTLIVFGTAGFGQAKKFKVVLDAGHGGGDAGTAHNGYKEKNIVLSVALKIGRILENEPGFDVLYTRKTDVFIELRERAHIANKANANLFVSIHCNGVNGGESAEGTETFVMGLSRSAVNREVARKENSVITLEKDYKQKYKGFNPNDPDKSIGIGLALGQEQSLSQSITLAGKIRDGFKYGLKKNDRGVKQIPLWVLDATVMPGVLIELGFISNKKEGAYLNSDDGQDEMARSIANAIISYKKLYDDNPDNDTQPIKQAAAEIEPAAAGNKKEAVSENLKINVNEIVYKIQISTSNRDISTKPANFKGLKNISKIKEGKQVKYYYGATNDHAETAGLLSEAKAKGFTSAFIVAFDGEKKISVQQALEDKH